MVMTKMAGIISSFLSSIYNSLQIGNNARRPIKKVKCTLTLQ